MLPIATKVTSSLAPSAAKVSDVTITLTVFFPPLDMETDSELISISHASFSSSEKPDVVILTVSSSESLAILMVYFTFPPGTTFSFEGSALTSILI